MQIAVLCEDSCLPGFDCEHGLSLWISFHGKQYLLDFGQSDVFARNAKKMGLNLTDVDDAFLSHAHYDHGNGLPSFFQINEKAKIWLQPSALKTACWKKLPGKNRKYIGLNFQELLPYRSRFKDASKIEEEGIRCLGVYHPHCIDHAELSGLYTSSWECMVPADYSKTKQDKQTDTAQELHRSDLELSKSEQTADPSKQTIVLSKQAPTLSEETAANLESIHPCFRTLRYDPKMRQDRFLHEQVIVFEEKDGLVVLCSCSHAGVDQIMERVEHQYPNTPIKAFIGGFHLKDLGKTMPCRLTANVEQTLACRLAYHPGTIYYTGHCTGIEAFDLMKKILGDRLMPLTAGLVIDL